MSFREEKTLAKKTIRLILSFYIVIALIFTTIHLYLEYRNEREELDHQIATLINTFKPVLSETAWKLQYDQLDALVMGIYNNKDIAGISIESHGIKALRIGLYKDNEQDEILYYETLRASPDRNSKHSTFINLYSHPFLIEYDNAGQITTLGKGTIYVSSNTLVERTLDTFLIVFFNAILKTSVLYFVSVWIITRVIAKPLRHLTDSINNFDPNNIKQQPQLIPTQDIDHSGDELSTLLESYNDMQTELVKKNKLIEKHTTELEEHVEERTKELAVTLKQLESTDNSRTRFLTTMSHEIRTPMNGVLGITELLESTELTDEQKKLTGIIQSSGKTLIHIINDILDFSKIEAGKLSIERAPFDAPTLIEGCKLLFNQKAQEKELTITVEIGNDIPTGLIGDAYRLRQIIHNLISNSLKFTHQGGVILTIEKQQGTSADNVLIVFVVADSGIGIPQKNLPVAFDEFNQGDISTSRKYGGSGLGLTISKRLVELMGGTITIDSQEGVGTRIEFSIPFEVSVQGGKSNSSVITDEFSTLTDFSHLAVLVVEDNKINQIVIEGLLKNMGIKADIASNGFTALEYYRESVNKYDIVLMDTEMPGMDGMETTKRIRNIEKKTGGHSTIVSVSAHVMSEHVKRAKEAGMDHFLTKPVSKSQLINMFRDVQKNKQSK